MTYRAKVISGYKRGGKMGFPTLNLIIPPEISEPYGIYSGWVWLNGEKMPAAVHFGPVPTFEGEAPTLEAYILDLEISGTPAELELEFVEYLREIRRFPDAASLAEQIARDVDIIRQKLVIPMRIR